MAEGRTTEHEVTEQEVVVHVFVPLDGNHVEEGVASLRAMWQRFRQLQDAHTELYAALPVQVRDVRPVPSAHGSVVVAGAQSADRLDQAILRRHQEILNMSLLLGAGPDREWSGLRERAKTIVGPIPACHLGAVTVELGKLPEGTPGDVDLSEPEGGGASEGERLLRMLGRVGADARLGSWAWSEDHRPEMPHFVRYLMHMTALRHQWATHHWLGGERAAGRDGALATVRLPYWGPAHHKLADAESELRYMRRAVEMLEENARHALEDSGLDSHDPLLRDRRFSSSFLRRLDDLLALRELAGPVKQPAPAPARAPVPAPAPERSPRAAGRSRELAVVVEWFPAHGGL
ncbi:MAG: hypothetical protein H5T76_38805, partial [Streptomyces sp.]|nr:hypothetical protein [Streptomyces sp.]